MYYKILNTVTSAVDRFLEAKGSSARELDLSIILSRPPSYELGDYATNVPILLAKRLGLKPAEVGKAIIGEMERDTGSIIGRAEVGGKGFLNISIPFERWVEEAAIVKQEGFGYFTGKSKTGRKVIIEFVSANPTGPLHVGHGRGAVIGDCLARILEASGDEVFREYYVNDRGKQVRDLGRSVHFRYNRLFDENFPEPEGDGWYRGDYILSIANQMKERYGSKLTGRSEEDGVFKDFACERMLEGIKGELAKLGISFDRWFRETELGEGKIRSTVDWLIEKGYARRSDDGSVAFCYRVEEFGDEKERILIKKDGDFTYFASDIPYHLDKLRRGFNLLINVWGADHHGYIPRMKAALSAFGFDPAVLKVVLVQMVSIFRGGSPVKMSKRAGEFITLREVIEEVGRDAFRFTFLTRRSDSHFNFDIEEVKKRSMDNPVYHVQYGYARLCSILRKAMESFNVRVEDFVDSPESVQKILVKNLKLEQEINLLKDAVRVREVVMDSGRALEPNRVATYLMEMSKEIQSYYTTRLKVHRDTILPLGSAVEQKGRIPEGWNIEKMLSRLIWVEILKNAMGFSLSLLGVSAPERMERVDKIEEDREV